MKKNSTILGIDLGGTKTAFALYDAAMQQCAAYTVPTPAAHGFDAVMGTIIHEVSSIIRSDTVCIGIGVPGMLDPSTRIVKSMPNIPDAEGRDMASILGAACKIPVHIENDARCFAYAEAMVGAGKGHPIVVGITLGTGVGGGVVIDGKLYHGASGIAGELGHLLLVPGKPPYETHDLRGDAEQFLSGTAMGKRCAAAKRPEEYLEGEVCGFMQPEIIREVAWLITNIVQTIDPSIIVFGGSAGRALGPHLEHVTKELKKWLLPSVRPPILAVSQLPDPSRRGAALLASLRLS